MKIVSEEKNLSLVTQLIRAELGSVLPYIEAGRELWDRYFNSHIL